MLELIDVRTSYGMTRILHGVSLAVKKGQVVGLLGRNGMGKTTTFRSIMGFTPPRRGTILFKGHGLTHLQSQRIEQAFLRHLLIRFLRHNFNDSRGDIEPRIVVGPDGSQRLNLW